MMLTTFLWQDGASDLIPPEASPASFLGWALALALAGIIWLMLTREKERREELKEWKELARKRSDQIELGHVRHHQELAEERKSKEDMAREVIALLQSSTQVLEGLRGDAKELEAEHRNWREEVRKVHSDCQQEIRRLKQVVERSNGGVPPSTG